MTVLTNLPPDLGAWTHLRQPVHDEVDDVAVAR